MVDHSKEMITILFIEDDLGDVELVKEALNRKDREYSFEICSFTRLREGLGAISRMDIDIILLDLSLPETQGLQTFEKVRENAPHIPIVVLTALNDEKVAIQTLHLGAQDYLLKDEIQGGSLIRTLRYALERYRLLRKLEDEYQQKLQRKEKEFARAIAYYQSYLGVDKNKTTVDLADDVLTNIIPDYYRVLMQYIQSVRLREALPSDEVKDIVRRLVKLKAGARDVVRIHLTALKQLIQRMNSVKEQEFSSDARLLLIEVLGDLVDLYRSYLKPQ